MKVLFLRFDAPLMSFGSVVVDQHNRTDAFPYRAMLTGLIANALGLTRQDEEAQARLQARIRYAARRDRRGTTLVDYQTVDFSQPYMDSSLGWTTRGRLEERKGGGASDGTHIRYRHYLADAIVTVALTLDPEGEEPTLAEVRAALASPARPLFLGRKTCVPSGPVLVGEGEVASLRQALELVPRVGPVRAGGKPRSDEGALAAIWHESEGRDDEERTRLFPRVEDRDMANAIHVGRRIYVEGTVNPRFAGDTTEGA